ncbi:MAG: ATP phosphoribosyltransferase [Dehalococcoidales bacterium]|nr:ATP phosphoribosyltransferase [Dehalococcoidales bacterium]MDP7109595.1 ATP phosphoribosyltransferase [Dehalococcoidales bacterium]MDP7310082.1 ATP phosphoribosyltransferase [Dehalococcoidales bacterium]MDP7409604.1 ATP phosphoribosyltransferase [Dehalococcoidales bacterium]MDP7675938.1 ATP phosphoribosyltransferase [Dehalococcoidales bacterium]
MDTQIKVALPKGNLLSETATLLEQASWGLDQYREGTRSYRLKSQKLPNLFAKIFQEKDIPIQVAVGNYDLGICGLDWVEELLAKYPSSALIKLRNLGYGTGALYMMASRYRPTSQINILQKQTDIIRLSSEYPNLAESFALNLRLKRFSIFPLWGAAEVYPYENTDLALIPKRLGEEHNHDLVMVSRVLNFGAYLIANKHSWESKDLSSVLAPLEDILTRSRRHFTRKKKILSCLPIPDTDPIPMTKSKYPVRETAKNTVWLALPDGHQQQPTIQFLNKAGIRIDDYPSGSGNRRPTSNLRGTSIKVIRPQDMPLQVANVNFDLAVTGKDWLTEHLNQFPDSPVVKLLDLKFGWVRIVAVVSQDLPVADANDLKQLYAKQTAPIRVASEYVNIADKYARDNHLGFYQIIPTWGATEAFLPEDADLLIENTETGSTIARHNLKIIDTLFESTAHLIGNKDSIANPNKSKRIKSITEILRNAMK